MRLVQLVSKPLATRVRTGLKHYVRKTDIVLPELIFLRESSSGHSESAYFLGKILSTLVRIFLSALHFTAFYLILTTPIVSFPTQLIVNLLYFYCMSPFRDLYA